MIYISEAHAQDEWPIGSSVKYNQTKSFEDRRKAASECHQALKMKPLSMFIDVPLNGACEGDFENKYAPWPIRMYLIDATKKILHIADPQAAAFTLAPIAELLG